MGSRNTKGKRVYSSESVVGGENVANRGVGFSGLLFLVFLTAKLAGWIAWSWWWVFAPLWAPAILAVLLIGVAAIIVAWSDA